MLDQDVDSAGTPCPDCDSHDTRVRRVNREVQTDSGAIVDYTDELTECVQCGEQFYTYGQSIQHSLARSAALRAANRYLGPAQIRRIRVRLGMKQEEFERALGVGRKTVVRWERGTVTPSSAANGLLWIADRHPEAFLDYARAYSDVRRPLSGKLEEPVAFIAGPIQGRSSFPVELASRMETFYSRNEFSVEFGAVLQAAEGEAVLEGVA